MSGVKSVPWEKTLLAFLKMVDGKGIDWWLSGSTALAVRGVDVSPNDIDLITDESGALTLSRVFHDYLFEPIVETKGWICNVFGKAFLYSMIDIAGGVNESADEPEPSDFGPIAASRLENIGWHGHNIRVPPLILQLRQCERRGLIERARKIRSAMGQQTPEFMGV